VAYRVPALGFFIIVRWGHDLVRDKRGLGRKRRRYERDWFHEVKGEACARYLNEDALARFVVHLCKHALSSYGDGYEDEDDQSESNTLTASKQQHNTPHTLPLSALMW